MLVRLLSFTVAAVTVVSAKLNDPQERKLVTYDKCIARCDLVSSLECKVFGANTDDKEPTFLGTATCIVGDCSPLAGFGGATCTANFDASGMCPNDIVIDNKLTCSTSGTNLVCPSDCIDPPTRCETVCEGDCPKTCKVYSSTDNGVTKTLVDTFDCTCTDCADGEVGNVITCTDVDRSGISSTCDNNPLPWAPTTATDTSFTYDTCKCVEGGDCLSDGDCCTLDDGSATGAAQECKEKRFKGGVRKKVCVKKDTSGGGDDCASCNACDETVAKSCFKGKTPCCTP